MSNQYLEQIGMRIRLRRVALRMNQTELAKAAGISQSAISLAEKGETALSIQHMKNVSKALDTSMCELLGEVDQKKAA